MDIGSQFQRFQSMAIWPHHYEPLVTETPENEVVEESRAAQLMNARKQRKKECVGQRCTDGLLSTFYFPSKDPFFGLCCPYSGWVFLLQSLSFVAVICGLTLGDKSRNMLYQSPGCLSVQASGQLRLTMTDHFK